MQVKHKTLHPNFYQVELGGLTIYFSYDTPIAFSNNGAIIASENIWSKTTAKHLGEISSKSSRVSHDVFTNKLREAINANS